MSRTSPIATAYQRLVSKGTLQPNPAQAALVDYLGQLQLSLITAASTPPSSSSSLWREPNRNPNLHLQQQSPNGGGNGIYIHGGVGTGKSRIADLFATTLAATTTVPTRRIHFLEFMMETHTQLHRARAGSPGYTTTSGGDPLTELGHAVHARSPVLCHDEFQVSDIADAMIVRRLFAAFWDRGGVVVSTSNRRPDELYLNGLNRPLFVPFIRELQRRCRVWEMGGERDYRLDVPSSSSSAGVGGAEGDVGPAKRVPVFFTDQDAFEASLATATGGMPLRPIELPVLMNRSITVHATPSPTDPEKLTVHAPFSTLCDTPLGASDYHALNARCATLYISDLPRFTAEPVSQLDRLRRFITLVDVAYEYRVRVVCLAAVPLVDVFADVGVQVTTQPEGDGMEMTVKKGGGSSSSMMSTFVSGGVEWSATGLRGATLARDGAGETDVRFAVGRAVSRLSEMGRPGYGAVDEHDDT